MDIDLYRLALEVAIGLVVGVLSGVLGIGGGAVLVAAMVFLLGVDQHMAQGVSLAVMVPTAIVGSVAHYRQGNVVFRTAGLLAGFAVSGAVVGSVVAGLIDGVTLRRILGIVIVALSLRMLLVSPSGGLPSWIPLRK